MKRIFAIGVALSVVVLCALAGVPGLAVALPLVVGATTTTASLDTMMKVIYSDPLLRDIVTESELMSLFKTDMNVKSEETTGGKYVEMAHYLRLAGAAGARAENDYIPVPESPRAASSRIYLKKVLGVVEMTGDVMEKVVADEGAFINYMERALPDTKERVLEQVDRMYIGFGAGIKARVKAGWVAGGRSVAVFTLDRALGVTGYEDAWLQFTEGERIVFSATAAGAALRNAGTTQSALVESVDPATDSITITADAALVAAIADNDYIFNGDAAGASSQNGGVDREIAGLLAGVDNGGILSTYNNIDRTTNPFWKATVIDGSAAPYSGSMTELLLTIADARVSTTAGGKVDVIVSSSHAPIGYWQSLQSAKVLNDPRNFTGGFGAVSIMLGDRTLPIKTARKLPPQVAFMLNTASWRRFTLGSWEWVARGGSIWNLVTDATGRKDAYFAFGKMYEQLACLRPRANVRIDGLTRQFDY